MTLDTVVSRTAESEPCVVFGTVSEGINSFLELHVALIRRLAQRVARPPLNSDDIAQDVLAALLRWHRQGAFQPEKIENPEAYLRVVIRNAAAREARRARTEAPTQQADTGELVDALLGAAAPPHCESTYADQAIEARALLERLKASLPARDAVAFALLVEDGLTVEQVATSLGTTPNNVYQMRHRIRSRAREMLDAVRESV